MTNNQETLIRQYDAYAKKLLANKPILAWILKECVEEFKNYSIETIIKCIDGEPEISTVAVDQDVDDRQTQNIEGLNTEDSSINEGKIYYDIRFRAVVPNTKVKVYLIINIEAQNIYQPGLLELKRSIYYVCRLVSSQKNRVFTGTHYEDIQKVYSIWIEMNVPKKYANTITKYHLVEENIVGKRTEKVENYDLINIIMIGLGDKDSVEEKSMLRLLDTMFDKSLKNSELNSVLEEEFGITPSDSMRKELNTMCNLGEGLVLQVTKEVTESVTASVTKEVTESVTKEVQINNWVQCVIGAMKNFGVNAEKALDAFGVPEDKREIVLARIDEQLIPVS